MSDIEENNVGRKVGLIPFVRSKRAKVDTGKSNDEILTGKSMSDKRSDIAYGCKINQRVIRADNLDLSGIHSVIHQKRSPHQSFSVERRNGKKDDKKVARLTSRKGKSNRRKAH